MYVLCTYGIDLTTKDITDTVWSNFTILLVYTRYKSFTPHLTFLFFNNIRKDIPVTLKDVASCISSIASEDVGEHFLYRIICVLFYLNIFHQLFRNCRELISLLKPFSYNFCSKFCIFGCCIRIYLYIFFQ